MEAQREVCYSETHDQAGRIEKPAEVAVVQALLVVVAAVSEVEVEVEVRIGKSNEDRIEVERKLRRETQRKEALP